VIPIPALLPALVQCAMCAQSLESGDHAHALARGIFWSILLLLGVFFSLVGGLVFAIVRMSRSPKPPSTPA